MTSLAPDAEAYPTLAERRADGWVHGVGVTAATAGVCALAALALAMGRARQLWPLGVYAACLLATFGLSAAYNLARAPRRRRLLRRFDHAAIFLMIAGSYTPFTTQRLSGGWAVWTTAAIWTAALAGVAGKLFFPGLAKRTWLVLYLALSWAALIAFKPLIEGVPWIALALLAGGGAIYTAGVLFYVRRTLKFRRAIWHGFVLAAASAHYGAVVSGVVLAPAR